MHKDSCIFCKIINGEIPSTIRYQDDDFIAFNDINPIAPVHVLIVPKKPIGSLEDFDQNNIQQHGKLLLVARKVAQKLGIQDNYKLFMNVGKKVQLVHHLHLHLYGGWNKETRKKIDEKLKQFVK
jgi:histidine triad (HIT) family protein